MQGWEYVTVYYKEAAEGGHGHKYPLIMANSPRITEAVEGSAALSHRDGYAWLGIGWRHTTAYIA